MIPPGSQLTILPLEAAGDNKLVPPIGASPILPTVAEPICFELRQPITGMGHNSFDLATRV
jgi:hypothetical protein